MTATTVLTADWLVDGTGGAPLRDPAITIADGTIIDVTSRDPGWAPPSGVTQQAHDGATVLPGLIDSHVHLAFSYPDQATSPTEHLAMATANARAALAGGVTTLRDLGSCDGAALAVRNAIRGGEMVGPRVLAADVPLTTPAGHLQWFGHVATGPDALRAAVDTVADAGGDVIKLMVTGGNSTPGSDPYTAQYTAAEVRAVVTAAHHRGLRVAAHVLCTEGVRAAVAGGVDTIEHGWTITGKRQDFTSGIVGEVLASGAMASVTAHEDLRVLLRSTDPADLAELRRRLHPHRALHAAGVPMVVHSDAGPGPTRFDAFAESVLAFHHGMQVSPEAAIAAATSLPARALGLEHQVGTVAPGMTADLLVVDGDVGRDPAALSRIRDVLVAGCATSGSDAPAP